MSQTNTPSFPDFGKLVPGFDFLQNLTKQAAGSQAQAIPPLANLGNWIAPTLNMEELDKRVQELKAVQFWLDQNAAALKATIQALEVQKMTLATLKGMNFNMSEVANAFKLKVSDSLTDGMQRMAEQGKMFSGLEIPPSTFQAAKAKSEAEAAPEAKAPAAASAKPAEAPAAAADAPAAPGMADPMQWWGALTQQFQAIASEAMKEVANKTALDATTSLAKDAVKTAADMAKGMAENATKTMTGGARAAMDTALKSSAWAAPQTAKAPARAASKAAAPKAAAPKAAASKAAAPKAAVSKTAAAKAPVKAKPKAPARKTAR